MVVLEGDLYAVTRIGGFVARYAAQIQHAAHDRGDGFLRGIVPAARRRVGAVVRPRYAVVRTREVVPTERRSAFVRTERDADFGAFGVGEREQVSLASLFVECRFADEFRALGRE